MRSPSKGCLPKADGANVRSRRHSEELDATIRLREPVKKVRLYADSLVNQLHR